ncbi:MAG: hypothetical protein DDT26_01681 [Dehalococcoidia bacterium]|nr:hypothetical protein [Chloroflexota bacterium]
MNRTTSLVRCLAHSGSTVSGVGASGKPGAVQASSGSKKIQWIEQEFPIQATSTFPRIDAQTGRRQTPLRRREIGRGKVSGGNPDIRQ